MDKIERLPAAPIYESPSESDEPARAKKTSLSRRWVAHFIDGIILGLSGLIVGALSALLSSAAWQTLWSLIVLLIPAVYYIRAYSTSGQTIGKRLRSIRVVSVDGTPLTWRQGLLRWIGYGISAFPLGLGYLWAKWDKDNQAWHDKIAGTVVVDDRGLAPEPLLAPAEAQRRQRRWQVALGFLTLLLLFVGALFAVPLVRGMVGELRAMEPWPGANDSPAAVVPPELAPLALGPAQIVDARGSNTLWAEGAYNNGAVAEYSLDAQAVVWIAALRYDDAQSAGEEYASMNAWAEEKCGLHSWVRWGNSGMIECGFTDAYNKTFLKDNWIIDVVVLDSGPAPPGQFIDDVLEVVVRHRETLE